MTRLCLFTSCRCLWQAYVLGCWPLTWEHCGARALLEGAAHCCGLAAVQHVVGAPQQRAAQWVGCAEPGQLRHLQQGQQAVNACSRARRVCKACWWSTLPSGLGQLSAADTWTIGAELSQAQPGALLTSSSTSAAEGVPLLQMSIRSEVSSCARGFFAACLGCRKLKSACVAMTRLLTGCARRMQTCCTLRCVRVRGLCNWVRPANAMASSC
jgi:hypothetical protein